MRSVLIALALLVCSASSVFAQSYELKVYQKGASVPLSAVTLSGVVCDQPKATGVNVNPTTVSWDDPANPSTKDCKVTDASKFALPTGDYEATLTVTMNDPSKPVYGTSPDSARAPFFVRPAPAAPTGVRLSQ